MVHPIEGTERPPPRGDVACGTSTGRIDCVVGGASWAPLSTDAISSNAYHRRPSVRIVASTLLLSAVFAVPSTFAAVVTLTDNVGGSSSDFVDLAFRDTPSGGFQLQSVLPVGDNSGTGAQPWTSYIAFELPVAPAGEQYVSGELTVTLTGDNGRGQDIDIDLFALTDVTPLTFNGTLQDANFTGNARPTLGSVIGSRTITTTESAAAGTSFTWSIDPSGISLLNAAAGGQYGVALRGDLVGGTAATQYRFADSENGDFDGPTLTLTTAPVAIPEPSMIGIPAIAAVVFGVRRRRRAPRS